MATTLQLEHSSSSHKTRNASSFYRPELDALRFFAFLAVFESHSTWGPASYIAQHHNPAWIGRLLQGISYAGGRGVDLFFALSAYLITELLLREKDQCGSLDVRSFYIRRILRIWPLYYLAIFLAEAASLLKPGHPFGFGYFVAFALLAGNWGASVAPQQAGWLVAPLWSVSIEEQFYLLWPPLVARLTRRGTAIAALLMIGLANLTRIIMLLAHCTHREFYFSTLVRIDEIAGGILLAVILRRRIPNLRNGVRLVLIAAAALCMILGACFKLSHFEPSWTEILGIYPASAVCCSLVVFSFLGMRIESRSLRYLGKISYGLYVFHLACLTLVDNYLHLHTRSLLIHELLRNSLALALSILAASLSYRFFESPFLKLKARFTHVESRPV